MVCSKRAHSTRLSPPCSPATHPKLSRESLGTPWGVVGMISVLEVVTLTRASTLFPDIDSCHVFIVSLYLFDSVPRQAESSVLRCLSVSGNLVISTIRCIYSPNGQQHCQEAQSAAW